MPRLSLRWRVSLAYAAIGLLMSLGFAAATTYIAEDYEHILIRAILLAQADNYRQILDEHPANPLPRSPGFSVYARAQAPVALAQLPSGIHEIDLQGRDGVHVGVSDNGPGGLIFVIDLGEIEALEVYLAELMVAIVAIGTLISGWLGWLLSGRAVQPVRQLASVVESLPVAPVRTHLAAQFGRDEVGRLAQAIDDYQVRLSAAEATEQGFYANASHELRTPLAILQGVVEVMRDDSQVVSGQSKRLERADRAIEELSLLLEALLLGARAVPGERSSINLAEAVTACRARLSRVHPDLPGRLQVEVDQALEVLAPRRWLDAILNLLLQRVVGRGPPHGWLLRIGHDGLVLSEAGQATEPEQRIERSDIGLGLIFVERLCRELGWRLEQGHDAEGSLQVRLLTGRDGRPANAARQLREADGLPPSGAP